MSQFQNPFWSAILYESIQTGIIINFFYKSNMANLLFYMFFSLEVETCGRWVTCMYELLASIIYKYDESVGGGGGGGVLYDQCDLTLAKTSNGHLGQIILLLLLP